MADSSEDRHPVEVLAEEFVSRQRSGESPSLQEYLDRFPEWADEIRDLFPTLLMIENLRPSTDELEEYGDRHLQITQLGDFRIVREIGRGGMGVVYEAVQESLGRPVALKILSGRSLNNERRIARFEREARMAAKLHHTNIVPVFGAGQQDGLHYLVMQFISGKGLDEVLKALRQYPDPVSSPSNAQANWPTAGKQASLEVSASQLAHTLLQSSAGSEVSMTVTGSLSGIVPRSQVVSPSPQSDESPDSPPVDGGSSVAREDDRAPISLDHLGNEFFRNVAQIGVQVASGLEHAHSQGTLHRDIKPANLLLAVDGSVWVADFGLAKLIVDDDLTNSGDLIGTLAYMAPEQFSGQVDQRNDLYGLGLTLYELATLRPAYSERDRSRLIHQITQQDPPAPHRINPAIPQDLETIILTAISREPSSRYQSAREMGEDLQRFLDDLPIRARRLRPAERLWRWCRRNRAVAALSGVAITLLMLIMVGTSIAYMSLRRAYQEKATALNRESMQLQITEKERVRTELTLDVALLTLDGVFEKFAPLSFVVPDVVGDLDEPLPEPQFQPPVSEQNAEFLQSLLKFYDRLTEQDRVTPEVRLKSGIAHQRVAEIQTRLGRHESAGAAYEQSARELRRLVGEFPDQIIYRRELADTLDGLGRVLRRQRRFDDCLNSHRESLAIRRKLTGQLNGIQSSKELYECVQTMNLVGIAQIWRKVPESAEQTFLEALDSLQELTDKAPDNPDYRKAESDLLRSLAWVSFSKQDSEEGMEYSRQSRAMLESLVNQYPESPRYSYDLVEMYRIPPLRRSDDDARREERLGQMNRAIELSRGLVERFPRIPEYEMQLSQCLLRLGELQDSQESRTQAIESFRESLEILKGLNSRFPSVPVYYVRLAWTGHALARALCEAGSPGSARSIQEEVVSNQLVYLNSEPESRWARFWLSRYYQALSETLALLGESTLAEDAVKSSEQYRSESDRSRNRFRTQSTESKSGS